MRGEGGGGQILNQRKYISRLFDQINYLIVQKEMSKIKDKSVSI